MVKVKVTSGSINKSVDLESGIETEFCQSTSAVKCPSLSGAREDFPLKVKNTFRKTAGKTDRRADFAAAPTPKKGYLAQSAASRNIETFGVSQRFP